VAALWVATFYRHFGILVHIVDLLPAIVYDEDRRIGKARLINAVANGLSRKKSPQVTLRAAAIAPSGSSLP
jgi:hypothetical protein